MRRGLIAIMLALAAAAGCAKAIEPMPVTTTAAPADAAPSPEAPDKLTLVAAGDLITQPELVAQAATDAKAAGRTGRDFTQILAALREPVISADLALCHMETPLARPQDPPTGYPIFNAPPELADGVAALGFDACSTASNHTLDYGEAGIGRTLTGLDRVGVRHAGSARNKAEADTPTIVDVRGVKVGLLSYTFSFNGIERPAGKAWIANLIDERAILAEARKAKRAGAQIVVLSLHAGTEYQHEPDIGQLGLARTILASPDVDLIIGHHVHVVQPFERVGGKWVAYGVGNVLVRFPDGSPEETQDAVVPRFTFTRSGGTWHVTAVEVRGTWMEYEPKERIVDLATALGRKDVTGERRATYQRAYDRIKRWINAQGAAGAGLVVARPGE
jgi:poly-gamma-glutamate synthesis protein (capsule biosynthesis protein)